LIELRDPIPLLYDGKLIDGSLLLHRERRQECAG
jgi:hypothetical protein